MPEGCPARAPWAAALLGAAALAGAARADSDHRAPAPAAQAPAAAQEPAPAPDTLTAFDRARAEAIERGLAWLAKAQGENPDGSFPVGQAELFAPIGVTALGALAFMAGGSSPGRGPYGREAGLAIDYLLEHVDLVQGSKEYGYISRQGDLTSKMHGHGFATLALAQAYGMAPRSERLAKALGAAVGVIQGAQSPEGGWNYDPRPSGHEGSVTVCLVQALRGARDVGVQVDPAVIARAEDYVLALKNDEGLFRYQLDRQDATLALTAAGISTLNAAGRYDNKVIRESVDAIWKGLELRRQDQGPLSLFPEYERLYLAQAFYHLSDLQDFDRWFAEEVEHVLRRQEPEGRWRCENSGKDFGDAYATAVNVLVLALPDGLLPIFQR
jgi:hypothetical protein